MSCGFWKLLGGILTGGSAVLFLLTSPAKGQDDNKELEELRSRLEKLEREHEELQQVRSRAPAAAGDLAPPLNDTDVKKIVGDYLKEQDAKKKQGDDAKKTEDQEKGYEVGSDLKMGASWNDGLILQTENKDFKLHIGGRFDQDWVFFNQGQSLKAAGPVGVGNLNDGVFFRRARLRTDGTAYEVFEWSTEVNFENLGLVTFQNFWVGINQLPILGTVRVGNNRVPQGLEAYTNENYNTFMERAAPFDAFLQNFNPGIFVSNTAFDEHMTWEALFHRIPTSGTTGIDAGNNNGTGADFGNGEYAFTGRATFLPYYENDGRCLLHFGSSYQFRESKFDMTNARDVVEFRTRSEIFSGTGLGSTTLGDNTRFLDTGLFQADNVQTVGAEALAIYGPFSVQSEWWGVFTEHAFTLPVKGQKSVGDPFFQGWYVQASYFLTGENRAYNRRFGHMDRVRPFTNFWWVRTDGGCCRGIGAWEIAARYSVVDLNDSAVILGTGGMLTEYTAGVNWYLNPNMRVQWNYVRANRDVYAPNKSGDVDEFGMSFHIDF